LSVSFYLGLSEVEFVRGEKKKTRKKKKKKKKRESSPISFPPPSKQKGGEKEKKMENQIAAWLALERKKKPRESPYHGNSNHGCIEGRKKEGKGGLGVTLYLFFHLFLISASVEGRKNPGGKKKERGKKIGASMNVRSLAETSASFKQKEREKKDGKEKGERGRRIECPPYEVSWSPEGRGKKKRKKRKKKKKGGGEKKKVSQKALDYSEIQPPSIRRKGG